VQPVARGEGLQVGRPGHAAVVVHDLAQHAARLKAGQARQIDGRLGVPAALEHAAGPCPQREHVPGPDERRRSRAGIGERAQGRRAIGRRDPGAGAVLVIDGDGEGRAVRFGVVGHHQRKAQRLQPLGGDGGADHAARVSDQEGERGGRRLLGGHHQIALVLATGVVDDHHHLPGGDGGDRVLNA
jgi:hypothetical protein